MRCIRGPVAQLIRTVPRAKVHSMHPKVNVKTMVQHTRPRNLVEKERKEVNERDDPLPTPVPIPVSRGEDEDEDEGTVKEEKGEKKVSIKSKKKRREKEKERKRKTLMRCVENDM